MRQVQRRIVGYAGDFVQSVRNGTNQLFHIVPRGRRNGMEYKAALLAQIPERLEPRAVGGGVELASDNDHGFFRQGFAEGLELAVDDFERVHRVIYIGITGIDQMDEEPRAFDVTEEADSESGAFMRPFNKPGEIGNDEGTAEFGAVPAGAAVGVDHAKV